jgi:hypothetical protein
MRGSATTVLVYFSVKSRIFVAFHNSHTSFYAMLTFQIITYVGSWSAKSVHLIRFQVLVCTA